MKKRKLFIFIINIIFTFSLSASSKDDVVISKYINAIIDKNFSEASQLIHNISNEELKEQAFQLKNVLVNTVHHLSEITPPKSENYLSKIIFKLSTSYYLLYTNPYSTKPFEHALNAYTLSTESNLRELKILSLITIQEVYNYEISQTNNNRLKYLKELGALIKSPEEKFHYNINLLMYNLQNIFYKVELNQKFIDDFEVLMSNFDKDHNFWPIYYSTIGVLYEVLGDLDNAIEFHSRVIKNSSNEAFLKHLKFRSNIRLSEINRRLGKFNKALSYVENAEKYINQSDSLRGIYYLNLYSSYNHAGNKEFDKAYIKLKLAYDQSIKLDYRKNTEQISNLNVKFQTSEKEKQILIEQEKKKRFRNGVIGLSSILILGSLVFFLIQKNTKRKQLLAVQEKELESQKVTNLLKDQELNAIDAMIEGQEKERQRIANDLHDDLGGLMATVKLHFNALKEKQSPELYKKTTDLLDEAYNKVRSVAHAKNSGVMAKKGLLKALNDMARTVSDSNQIQVAIIDHGLEERLENSLELTIFRIAQELITNVIKHAHASEAAINITKHQNSLNIMVEDNGKGFNTKNITKNSGMGIHSIDKRIENLGGQVTIDSEINKGTTIIIDIPI